MIHTYSRRLHISLLEVLILAVLSIVLLGAFNLRIISSRLSAKSSSSVSLDGSLKSNLGSVTGKVDELNHAAAYVTIVFWAGLGMVFYLVINLAGMAGRALHKDAQAAKYNWPTAEARAQALKQQSRQRVGRFVAVTIACFASAFAIINVGPTATYFAGAGIATRLLKDGFGYGVVAFLMMLGVLIVSWLTVKIMLPKINQFI